MLTDFQYIYGEDTELRVLAIVTRPISVTHNCPMEDAEEDQGWGVEIQSVTLEDGSDFDTNGLTEGNIALDELLQEAAVEAYGEEQ